MEKINIDDFTKVDIRIGTIIEVGLIEGADKLLKFQVDLGDDSLDSTEQGLGKRQILSGIREYYSDIDSLVGLQVPVIVNLESRKMKGEMSEGMILFAIKDGKPVFLNPRELVLNGSEVR